MIKVNGNEPGRSITPVSVDRRVHSCWVQGDELRIIFVDMLEMVVAWGNTHAELKGRKLLSALPAMPITEGPISRLLAGRVVDYCYLNDADELVIKCKDGHECVVGYDTEPVIRRMDVKVYPEGLDIFGGVFPCR